MLVKYYLSDNIKALFEDFALGLRNAWASFAQCECGSTRSHVKFPMDELWDFCLQLAQASTSLVGLR